MMKYIKKIEDIYNDLSYNLKEEVGFPSVYMFLSAEQERFVVDLLSCQVDPSLKAELQESILELKGLVDEL